MERLGHNSERKRAEPPPSREEREMSDEVESEAGRAREPGSHWEPLGAIGKQQWNSTLRLFRRYCVYTVHVFACFMPRHLGNGKVY